MSKCLLAILVLVLFVSCSGVKKPMDSEGLENRPSANPDEVRQNNFAAKVNQIIQRNDLTAEELDKIWMEHMCFKFGSFVVRQKIGPNEYEIIDVWYHPLAKFNGPALLKTKNTSWNSPGYTTTMFTTKIGTTPIVMESGFTQEIATYEESPECEILYQNIQRVQK